ncbi:MAG: hypothetical protein V4671_19570 [Armatimonadota bacterium]
MQFSQYASAVRIGILGLTALGSVTLNTGCGGGTSTTTVPNPTPIATPLVLAPACSDPVPLRGTYDPRGSRLQVTLIPGTDATEQAPLLGAKYGFTPQFILSSSPSFQAELSPEALARLRCDPFVADIYYPLLRF